MRLAIVSTIARPRPAPPRARRRRPRLKRSKRGRGNRAGSPPLVADVKLDGSRPRRGALTAIVAGAVAQGVVDQVPSAWSSRGGRPRLEPVGDGDSTAAVPGRVANRRGAVAQLERPASQPASSSLVGAGDTSRSSASWLGGPSPRRADRRAARAPRRERPCASASSISARRIASGVRSSWLASATKRRSRRSARLEAVEHLVQRPPETGELVTRRRDRQALARPHRGSRRPGAASPRPAAAPGRRRRRRRARRAEARPARR